MTSKPADKLVVMSSSAGSMTPEVDAKIRQAFEGSSIVEFDPKMNLEQLVAPSGTVVVAGGDGTIGWVVRALADTDHPVGLLAMGTFNNFARSLGLPTDVDQAIQIIKDGQPRSITLGRVNDRVFLEAAAIGLFGEVIALGESAKGHTYEDVVRDMKRVIKARAFEYDLTGDIGGDGIAMSLVFTNTRSTGSQMPVSDKTPVDPFLELSVHAGSTRMDIAKRVLARLVFFKPGRKRKQQTFRFRSLEVTTKPQVSVYADNTRVGHTPATITAEVSALRVILPK